MTPGDKRDLELVAQGKSPVGEFNAVVARALLEIEEYIYRPRAVYTSSVAPPFEETVTSDSELGQILAEEPDKGE